MRHTQKALEGKGLNGYAAAIKAGADFIEMVLDSVLGGGRAFTFSDDDIEEMKRLLGRE